MSFASVPRRRGSRARVVIASCAVGAATLLPVTGAAAASSGHHRPVPFGTVVNWRGASHTATIVGRHGQLLAVHSRRPIADGTVVAISHLRRLRNGTYSGVITRLGHTRRARVRGVVVATLHGGAFAIGARGTMFIVRSRAHHGPLNTLSSGRAPFVGESVMTDVQIGSDGSLTEIDIEDTSNAAGPVVEIEGTLAAVDPIAHTITIAHEEDGTITNFVVLVPPTVDLSTLSVGQEMHVLGTPNPDGTFSLAVVPQTLHIEGRITAIDPTARTVTLTMTEDGITMTFVVTIPPTIDITGFSLGAEVELDVIQNADGTYTLVQGSNNGNAGQAEDQGDSWSGGGGGTWAPSGASGDAARRGA